MKVKGFTLIELMIVIAIMGLLLIFALPAYLDYSIRARVVEGLNLASAAQLAVNETTLIYKTLPANQAATGYASPQATQNVASIGIGPDGVITITYTQKAGDGTIVLTPILDLNRALMWDCTGGTLPAKYRPASCRP